MTVVTESFVLNMTGNMIIQTMATKYTIRHFHVQTQQKTLKQRSCQIYSAVTYFSWYILNSVVM